MKKRVSSLLICLSLALTLAFPVAAGAAAPEGANEIWDRAGLEAIADDPSGSYTLMADIDMGDALWTPIAFSGTLDGGGHTLYNLTIREVDPEAAISVDGNAKEYDTYYTALFSRTYNATIRDVHLLGVDVQIATGENCFASALVGYAENTEVTGCSVSGRIYLEAGNTMIGVAGIVGFGYGRVADSSTDVTLTLVDSNQQLKCEEFMGAVMATGYVDVENCQVKVRAYTSVYGYVHNGGVVGMYFVHTDDTGHKGYVRSNTSDAEIYFFEANEDRRAYCDPIVGEPLNWSMQIADNTTLNFVDGETTDYSRTLSPESCDDPVYTDAVTAPNCTDFGFTTHTCDTCDYSYADSYTAPAHQPGEWEVETLVSGEGEALVQHCTLCGALLAEEPYAPATAYKLSESSLKLQPGDAAQLAVTAEPEGASLSGHVFTSSDEAVATVDARGNITAVGSGKATITCASADGIITATCTVQVGGAFPLWLGILLGVVVVIIVLAVILVLIARSNRKKRARRRAAQQRNVYRR